VNLAARLQAQAGPGQILISEEAHRRTERQLADSKLHGDKVVLSLKGFEQSVPAYRVVSLSSLTKAR
jgi:class 3 adenylate cyclase